MALFQQGKAAEAVPYLTRAAEANPGNAQMWKAAGVALASQKQYALAEGPFRRACELSPKLPDACYFHARVLYALDRYDGSLAALEHADARDWKVRLARAQALEALGDAARSEQEYRQALTMSRNSDASPGVAFGLFLVRQGRLDEAIPVLEQVLARYPDSADAHTYLGRALAEKAREAEAIPHLERAVALNPGSAQAHLLLAKAYVRSGHPEKAQSHFEAAAQYGQEK